MTFTLRDMAFLVASAGGGTWTPAEITTALWLKEDGTIDSWIDHSGNNLHFTQSNTPSQPNITDTLNGLTIRTFDGIDDFMRSSSSLTSGTYTGDLIIFLVQRRTKSSGGAWFTERSTTLISSFELVALGAPLLYYLSSDGFNGSSNHTINLSDYNATANWSIISKQAKSGLRNILWIDGTQRSVTAGTASNITGGTAWATIGSREAEFSRMGGNLAEVIALTTAPSTDIRQRIEGYLAHKWGLTANLPSDHPYKSVAPTA